MLRVSLSNGDVVPVCISVWRGFQVAHPQKRHICLSCFLKMRYIYSFDQQEYHFQRKMNSTASTDSNITPVDYQHRVIYLALMMGIFSAFVVLCFWLAFRATKKNTEYCKQHKQCQDQMVEKYGPLRYQGLYSLY